MRPQADYLWTNWAVLFCEIIEQREVSPGFITEPKLHSVHNHAGLKHKSVYLVTTEISCPQSIPVILYLSNFHSCCAPIFHVLTFTAPLNAQCLYPNMKGTCAALLDQ